MTKYDPQNPKFKKICVAKEFDGADHKYTFDTLQTAIKNIYNVIYKEKKAEEYLEKFVKESQETLDDLKQSRPDYY